jgi:ABC-type phosphate transport system permease subunit
MRQWPPILDGYSQYFASVNRNKRSVVLDLKQETDKAAARKLALSADILLENFRPGVMAKFGLDYASLSKEHPALVYCSVSAFGQTGPRATEGGFDMTVQAMSGVPSIVAGLFIYAVWMIGLGNSYNAIAGAGALTILMIPTVARVSEEVLKLIPNDLREAGLALGATQWRTVGMIVLPAAKSGLVTAIVLGVARVAGETAPLLLTIGGSDQINFNPAAGNNSALPFYVWKNYSFGSDQAVARAWLGILILMILVFFLFSVARYFGRMRDGSR